MLDALLERDEIRGIPVAIFVNKIDRHEAVAPEEFLALMGFRYGGLDRIRRERAVGVFFGSVLAGQGMFILHLFFLRFSTVVLTRDDLRGRDTGGY